MLETVPDDGTVRQLVMPLNWLCTQEANPSLSCGAGQTCQAGACASAAVDVSDLPLYSVPDAACFDVATCFQVLAGGYAPIPTSNPGSCTVPSSLPGTGEDVNVALIVNTSQIGNYGACVILGDYHSCLIPLARGAPEGWTFTDDSGTTISLPLSVCNDVDIKQTLTGVMVSSSCSFKQLETPTCSPKPTCIPVTGVCPDDWGTADWQGYTCSGTAYPAGVQWCDAPPAILDAGRMDTDGSANAGRLCCSLGPEGLPDSGLLIDNMTGGPEVKLTPPFPTENGGWWFTYGNDDGGSPLFPPQHTLFTYTTLPAFLTPDGGPMNAACLRSEGFNTGTGYPTALEGFSFVESKDDPSQWESFDVNPYTGIRFWAWSLGPLRVWVSFPDSNTDSQDLQSACDQNPDAGGCNPFGENINLSNDGREYHVEWGDLSQAPSYGEIFDAGLVKQQVSGTLFQVNGNNPGYLPPFDFCVSQIYFTVAGVDAQAADSGVDAE
jgi:hypothetical protein